MFKKIVSMLLAVSSLMMMSSCSKKYTSMKEENGQFIPQSEIGITVWNTQGTDYTAQTVSEKDVVVPWLENKTMVKIENIYGNDGGQWDTKLSKLVAGDNMPHVVYCGSGQGPAHFAKLKELGQLWELTPEMLQKYAPNVWSRTPKEYWDAVTVDGKIQGIPYHLPISETTSPNLNEGDMEYILNLSTYNTDVTYNPDMALYIRDDILQQIYPDAKSYDELVKLLKDKNEPIGEYLLDVPIYSTEEYVEFLEKIQSLNLKEGEKTVYPVGFAGSDNWVALAQFGADLCGYKNHAYTGTWNWKTQRIEIPIAHKVIEDAARLVNEMINDKLIDPESLVNPTSKFTEKILNGEYAVIPIYMSNSPDIINAELEASGKTFRYRPFITQVPAQEEYPAFKERQTWLESLCFLKTLSEDELHQVLYWMDVQYSDEFEQVSRWGAPEAGLYTEDENGLRRFKDEKLNDYFINGNKAAIENEEDTLGLGNGSTFYGMFSVQPTRYSKWDPNVMHKSVSYSPVSISGFRFKADSEHIKNVLTFPSSQGWASEFAEIPEVVDFWAEREQWENAVALALAAKPGEFDAQWTKAMEKLNSLVDIKAMEDKMTEIAKPVADEIAASGVNDGINPVVRK